jgi:hypothetical protein
MIESVTALAAFSAIIALTVAALLAQAREEAKPRRRSPFGRVNFN